MNSKKQNIIVQRPVIDKLAYVLPRLYSETASDRNEPQKIISRRIERAKSEGLCVRAYTHGARYLFNINIALPGGSNALVQIGALQPLVQKGDVRVSVNPARFGPNDVNHLNMVMRRIIGKTYPTLMKHARLNCIDVATDIHGLDLSTTLVMYQYATKHTVFGKRMANGSHIETYNFGSVNSNYMTTVYDKRVERVHRAIQKLLKTERSDNERLKENAVKQLDVASDAQPITRVEIRGKKMNGLPLHKLPVQTNRFKWFKFACLDSDGAKLSPLTEQAFISMCRDTSVKATLAKFKGSKHEKNVNNFWNSRQARWWKPEKLWPQVCLAIREIGLFPEEAFNERDDEQES